jgi:hypothetical protein
VLVVQYLMAHQYLLLHCVLGLVLVLAVGCLPHVLGFHHHHLEGAWTPGQNVMDCLLFTIRGLLSPPLILLARTHRLPLPHYLMLSHTRGLNIAAARELSLLSLADVLA